MEKELEQRDFQAEAEDFGMLALIHKHVCGTETPETRVCTVIRNFLAIEEPDEELRRQFMDWLRNGCNAGVKERAYLTLYRQADGDGAGERG